MYTIKDIAKLAEVSVSTASLVLNQKKGVSSKTRERVLTVAKQLRYVPNNNARNLSRQHSKKIGLVITDIANPFFGMLAKEINKCVRKCDYDLTMGVSEDMMQHEKAVIKRFIEDRVEGVILVPTIQPEYDLAHLYQLQMHGIPFVFSTAAYRGISSDCVMCDMEKGSYLLAKRLIETGHRKVYVFAGSRDTMYTAHRIDGCKKAFAEASLVFKDEWIYPSLPFWEGGYDTTQKVLNNLPDAIMTVNDIMAMGVLKCLKENGIRVPHEISVTGFDDLEYVSILETPLTTIRQPIGDIASKSVEQLFNRLHGDVSPESTIYVEPILKERDTTSVRGLGGD